MTMPSIISGRSARLTLLLTLTAAVAGCGGGGGTETIAPPPPAPVTDADREAAAQQTADTNAACTSLTAFYWEIGDTSGVRASGQAGSGAPGAGTEMSIASASKWIFAAYALEKKGTAALSETDDVPFLNFTSGYSGFEKPTCPGFGLASTVDDCLAADGRGDRDATEAANRTYDYNSGHMQKYASLIDLGSLNAAGLATEVLRLLAPTGDWTLSYDDVQLAGSVRTSAAQYRVFLQKMLGNNPSLRIADQLGKHAVCTLKSATCANTNYSPSPLDWQYSLGHWVEDDQATQDAENVAYSSAGARGFYPWVNQDRSLYGILAREDKTDDTEQRGFKSAACGQLLRRAFVTATVQ